MSALVGATQAGPITARQMVDTAVSVPNGQSAAVGGLISSSTGTDYNKLPSNVSKNPLVSLYASKSFRKKQSQFVVFVTPIIKTSASEGAQEIKRKFRLRN